MDWRRLLPWYWIQNDPTCMVWDARLNALLDGGSKIEIISDYRCMIDGVQIWTANYPYAYGSPARLAGNTYNMLPTVKTRIKLRRAVRAALVAAIGVDQ